MSNRASMTAHSSKHSTTDATGISKSRALGKSFLISMKIKGPWSLFISLLGFTTALLPVLLASQLEALTNELQHLMGSRGDASPALRIFLTVVVLYISEVVIRALCNYASELDAVNMRRYLKETILKHKCEVRYRYIENQDEFQKRLAFIEEYAGFQMAKSISNMLRILQLALAAVLSSLTLLSVSPYIVLILFVTGIPAALLAYFQQDETFRYRAKWMEEGALAIHYYNTIGGANNSLDCLQEIRHFSLSRYLKQRWREIAKSYIKKKNRLMKKHVLFNTAADFLRSVVYLVILLITAYQIYEEPAIGLGVFTLVFTLSGQLQTIIGDFLVDIMVLLSNIPYMQEVFYLDTLEREPVATPKEQPARAASSSTKLSTSESSGMCDASVASSSTKLSTSESSGMCDASVASSSTKLSTSESSSMCDASVVVSDLCFTYPGTETEILHHINVSIKSGEKIAVVGENGSGKSTFISLLCGMFAPDSGEISVGGVNVVNDPVTVHKMISVVFQDFAHYEASLRENITVSDKSRNASDAEIMDLLRRINIDDVVTEQKDGLSTLVGSFSEKANNLSGGQWQKISLARAAYRQNASIMILDEPTSALDPMAEATLYRDFATLTGDRTTILISHRLGITSIVDRILVFDDGCIVEDGTHAELMKQNGLYARMYAAQAKWYQ